MSRACQLCSEEDRFLALYGKWRPMTPVEFAPEMVGFDRPWWLVGGWAIEAATGLRPYFRCCHRIASTGCGPPSRARILIIRG